MKRIAKTDRREFLGQSASGVGALALGAPCISLANGEVNDRIRVGVVGLGNRGGTLLNWLRKLQPTHNLQITAVCDIWRQRREAVAHRLADSTGRAPVPCRTIAELSDRADVDVVIIATADFQHAWHAAHAVLAGKDVYVEKPFACDFEQAKQAAAVIARSNQVFQVGTQSRGSNKYYAAADFIQSGKLGQVTYVEISEPIFQQRWRLGPQEPAPRPEDTDWREFLTYLPADLPFSARHYREFRLFWPFSSGPFCQWMSHRIDLVNLVLGKLPVSAVALGGVYLWQDGRTNPDTVQCLLEYPGGTLVSYHMRMGNDGGGRGITFFGSCGTLELEQGIAYGNGGGGLVCRSERSDGEKVLRVDRSRLLRGKKEGGVELQYEHAVDYLGHFFDCVRQRSRPRGDIEAAYGHSVASIMANLAYRADVKVQYDATRRFMYPAHPVSPIPFVDAHSFRAPVV